MKFKNNQNAKVKVENNCLLIKSQQNGSTPGAIMKVQLEDNKDYTIYLGGITKNNIFVRMSIQDMNYKELYKFDNIFISEYKNQIINFNTHKKGTKSVLFYFLIIDAKNGDEFYMKYFILCNNKNNIILNYNFNKGLYNDYDFKETNIMFELDKLDLLPLTFNDGKKEEEELHIKRQELLKLENERKEHENLIREQMEKEMKERLKEKENKILNRILVDDIDLDDETLDEPTVNVIYDEHEQKLKERINKIANQKIEINKINEKNIIDEKKRIIEKEEENENKKKLQERINKIANQKIEINKDIHNEKMYDLDAKSINISQNIDIDKNSGKIIFKPLPLPAITNNNNDMLKEYEVKKIVPEKVQKFEELFNNSNNNEKKKKDNKKNNKNELETIMKNEINQIIEQKIDNVIDYQLSFFDNDEIKTDKNIETRLKKKDIKKSSLESDRMIDKEIGDIENSYEFKQFLKQLEEDEKKIGEKKGRGRGRKKKEEN